MAEARSSYYLRAFGTLAAAVGAIIVVINVGDSYTPSLVFPGGLLVVGGLLLRIEAAVRRSR